ncbi:hypothetical protein ABT095_05300 [Kitasatospora sp. NPDC002227]|uniref:hypothetical protein n=1 Tax=Kitasatospora sp. NPDC002227 TaxID=3154773 RepID=UPI0033207FD4
MMKRLVVLAVVLTAAAGLGAGPAAADGPKNEKEAAVCRGVVSQLLNLGGTPATVNALCAVQGNGG